MNKTLHIIKRELASYFGSPIAYVFLIIFLILTGFFTFMMGGFFQSDEASLARFFVWHPWLYMLLVPAIGMRMWAEERRMGTLELLFTLPLSAKQAIMGKFLAGWLFLGIALLLTLPMPITVCYLGDPDVGPMITGGISLSIHATPQSLTTIAMITYTRPAISAPMINPA